MRLTLTGSDFCAMIIGGSMAIAIEKQQINDLNVFPVPDGDTGTNMTLTMNAGMTEIGKKNPGTVGQAAEVTASALLRGARGNSGVILSLLFRGISKGLKDVTEADAKTFAQSMVDGVEAAYKAVMKPAEGTMLTVSRVASAAALEFAAKERDIELMFEHTIAVGYEALAQTIDQNPVLKKAGVVDAGGKGYLYILEGMLRALRGEEIAAQDTSTAAENDAADFAAINPEDITFTYCTEFIIQRENQKDAMRLQGFLDGIGDSLVVVDDETLIKVHVHTDDPGRALTESLAYGSLTGIKIENMREQHAAETARQGGAPTEAEEDRHIIAPPEKAQGIVVVSAGAGLASVFTDLGVDKIITGGQTMNPCTDEIVRAIDAVPAETVYVFPNNKNIILAAQQAVPLASKQVVIIPTHTIPQGVSALLSFDPTAEVAENLAAMEAAASGVKTAQITYAARDSDFDGHQITEGQYLALFDNAILSHADEFDITLADTITAIEQHTPEFITVFYGEDVDETTAAKCAETIQARIPSAEITVLDGGQPVYYFMISVE
ncbi:MAG: DAK2 domain-containing protein [Oscillospiraceae bacterium]|nr:DAK2 domain-containing protein [Oscillospiraceae bacterium]